MFFGTGAFGLLRRPCVPPSSELGFSVLGYDARDADQATSINQSGGFFNHQLAGVSGSQKGLRALATSLNRRCFNCSPSAKAHRTSPYEKSAMAPEKRFLVIFDFSVFFGPLEYM